MSTETDMPGDPAGAGSPMSPLQRAFLGLGLAVAALLLLIQFLGPSRTNPATDRSQVLEAHLSVPPSVGRILSRACRNCHSNETRWPWYGHVAPLSWFLIDHVTDARHEMNFSRWGTYSRRKQRKLLGEMCEQVREKEMPLPSYLWMHREARLTPSDIRILCRWARRQRSALGRGPARGGR